MNFFFLILILINFWAVVNGNEMRYPDTCVDSKDSKDGIKESLMFIKATGTT